MKTLSTLVKREWWEVRGSFLYSPIIIGLVLILLGLGGLLTVLFSDVSIQIAHWQHKIDPDMLPKLLYAVGSVFISVLWLTVLNYFWNCLYYDRKDGSVLFWQSMPTSQTQTVLSKLIAGLIIAPIVAWICLVVTEAILLVIAGFTLSVLNLPVGATVWHPVTILWSWGGMLLVLFIQGIWLFPIVGWFMFCSAYTKRTPFLLAIVPPLVVIIIEKLLSTHQYFLHFILSRFAYMGKTWAYFAALVDPSVKHTDAITSSQPISFKIPFLSHMSGVVGISASQYTIEALIGLGVGVVFLSIAAALRARCYGFER